MALKDESNTFFLLFSCFYNAGLLFESVLDVVILSMVSTPQRHRPLEGFRVSGVCQGSNYVPINTDAAGFLYRYSLFQSFFFQSI